MAIYFHFSVLIRTFAVTVISVVKFLITCLISEISKAKTFRKKLVIRHLGYSKILLRHYRVKFFSLTKELAKMFNVKIHLDLFVYTSYVYLYLE